MVRARGARRSLLGRRDGAAQIVLADIGRYDRVLVDRGQVGMKLLIGTHHSLDDGFDRRCQRSRLTRFNLLHTADIFERFVAVDLNVLNFPQRDESRQVFIRFQLEFAQLFNLRQNTSSCLRPWQS